MCASLYMYLCTCVGFPVSVYPSLLMCLSLSVAVSVSGCLLPWYFRVCLRDPLPVAFESVTACRIGGRHAGNFSCGHPHTRIYLPRLLHAQFTNWKQSEQARSPVNGHMRLCREDSASSV